MGADSLPERTALEAPRRSIAAAVSFSCMSLAGVLALHHPLAPVLTAMLLVLWGTLVFLRPVAWFFVLPALLPVIDLAPFTGWLIVEEFDILVLGAAAGAYAAIAWRGRMSAVELRALHARDGGPISRDGGMPVAEPVAARLSGISAMLIGLFGVSTLLALYRGLSAAGTMEFEWFDGYYDAANSLRIAKSYLFALLMLPPLLAGMRRSGARAMGALAAGLTTGLCLASLAIVWERLAFPGLLNFSTDYRVTALFWEMHVGGAALDGFLALTFPFAIMEILSAPSRTRWLLAGATVLIAGYACLVTFSRGVYLALPVSIGFLALLLARRGTSGSLPFAAKTLGKGCLLAVAMAALSYLTFRAGGYRALLAVLGVFAITLPLGAAAPRLPASGWLAALGAGMFAAAIGYVAATWIPKGAYVVFGLAFAACAVALLSLRRSPSLRAAIIAFASYFWLNLAASLVALGWGGIRAFQDIVVVLAILVAVLVWRTRQLTGPWPRDLRMQGALLGMAALTAITAAVFSGGAYMSDRFGSSERDAAGRMQHWRDGVGMLKTPGEWVLGAGTGRFPENFLFRAADREFPGSSRIGEQQGNRYLMLSGPRHEGGFGEMFRVAQRVHVEPGTPYSIVLDARASKAALLHLELCQRHLLYVDGCAIAQVPIPAGDGSWQRYVVQLDGTKLLTDSFFVTRPAFFAMATESPQSRIDITNVSVIGHDGAEVLANRDFSQDMAHWFTVSDRFHLPWHIKNIGLNILFDQGIAGLLLWLALTGAALYRLVAGSARGQPVAPFLAAALVGFLVVGLFDSLLDVPRLAFMFYLLAFVGLALRRTVKAKSPEPLNHHGSV